LVLEGKCADNCGDDYHPDENNKICVSGHLGCSSQEVFSFFSFLFFLKPLAEYVWEM
jgi:hypothetical protein